MKRLLILALAPLSFAVPAHAQTTGPQADPYCMKDVPWEVDPGSGPIQVASCRSVDQISAPNAEGWVVYNRPGGAGFIQTKTVSSAYKEGSSWTVIVVDNGGGSGNFGYTLTGAPDVNGVIQKPKVAIWKGN